jgi:hypothetical protein
VAWITWRDPEPARPARNSAGRERWRALRGIWGVLLLVVVVLGGIYGGVFTATEGAGIGAPGAFFFALARRALTLKRAVGRAGRVARTTAMLFTLLIAAMMFANFVNFTSMPGDLKDWITEPRPVAGDGGRRDDADLRDAGHHHGRAVDGAADHPAVLPDRHLVPFAAGGPTDKVARDLAEALRKPLGQPPSWSTTWAGAGSTIGTAKVAKAAPDGYTCCCTTSAWPPRRRCTATCPTRRWTTSSTSA